ncbi:MAG: ATP-binding protein [Gammaproteobacteria bacterium]|nr:ATP-binding protein [Gammaproteobacteria bacterium]
MKLSVRNFGPIKKAEITLGPMTVFVGPSNAGKSYLAILAYAILSTGRNTASAHIVGDRYFSDWKNTSASAKEKSRNEKEFFFRRIEESFKAWAKQLSVNWMRRMGGCFLDAEMPLWMKEGKMVKVSDDQGQLVLDLLAPGNSKLTKSQKQAVFEKIHYFPEIQQLLARQFVEDGLSVEDAAREMYTGWKRGTFVDCLDPVFASMLLGSAPDYPPMPAHYLPATRSSLMQNLRNQIVLTLGSGHLSPGRNLLYPLFITDFLEKILYGNKGKLYRGAMHVGAFEGTNRQKKKIQKVGSFVEGKIMEGALNAEDIQGVYPEFRYVFGDDSKRDFVPLLQASSMVAELAALVVFIREHIYPGDLLIMEEPEAGLHPAAQRDIVNALVQLSNAGVRVLFTTHSDILLEQLGNYVQAAEIGEKLNGESLAKANISAYLFAKSKGKKKNTEVEKVEFGRETGILSKDHMAVSSALYNETVSLLEKGDEHAQD